MIETRQNFVRTYHPTVRGVICAIALIPLLMLVTWPAAALLGDARTLMIEFLGVPILCCAVLTHLLHGNRFEFCADEAAVSIQLRILLIPIGDIRYVPFQLITNLNWCDDGEGSDLRMTIAGEETYYVTMSRTKARQIAQLVLQAQPNLKPNLHPHLV